jgi:hypothetical protein
MDTKNEVKEQEYKVYCRYKRCLALMWGGHVLSNEDDLFLDGIVSQLDMDTSTESLSSLLAACAYGETIYGDWRCDGVLSDVLRDIAEEEET